MPIQRSPLLARIEREASLPGLTDILAGLPPTDLQSLLLEVYRINASRRKPADVLADYEHNRFVSPGKVPPSVLLRWESIALDSLPSGFEAVELAPVCPLGTSSAVAAVDQNWAVPTVRNTEVVSDPTNVMALECARRRKHLLAGSPKSSEPVQLAARHRVLRPQRFTAPGLSSHFRLFSLCSAGRDSGSRRFEISNLAMHCRFYLKILRAFIGPDRPLALRLTDFAASPGAQSQLENEFLSPLRHDFRNVTAEMNPQRTAGKGYYRDLCCKIYVEDDSGKPVEVADGGSVDWTQKLLSNSKERLIISGIGSERVCALFK